MVFRTRPKCPEVALIPDALLELFIWPVGKPPRQPDGLSGMAEGPQSLAACMCGWNASSCLDRRQSSEPGTALTPSRGLLFRLSVRVCGAII